MTPPLVALPTTLNSKRYYLICRQTTRHTPHKNNGDTHMKTNTDIIDATLRKYDYTDNLARFIERMTTRGFTIVRFFTMPDQYELHHLLNCYGRTLDYHEIAHQALNYEHTNLTFQYGVRHEGVMGPKGYRQTISVMMTGDPWCDVVPINDWSYSHQHPDAVKEELNKLRTELLSDEALEEKLGEYQ